MSTRTDIHFAPPKSRPKSKGFQWFPLFVWITKEGIVWAAVLSCLAICAALSNGSLLVAGLVDFKAAVYLFAPASLFALLAGFILWGRNRLRGSLVMAVLHLALFSAAYYVMNPSPNKIAREFLALENNRAPSSFDRTLKIVAPASVLYLAQVEKDVVRATRFMRALREQPEQMCPGQPIKNRMACYSGWVNRFRTAQPFTLPGQLVMLAVGVATSADIEKSKKGLTGNEKKVWEAGLVLELLEALTLNSEIIRSGRLTASEIAGVEEPAPYTVERLTKIFQRGKASEADFYVVHTVDKVAYLTMLETMAGLKKKSAFTEIFATLEKFSPYLNAEQKQRVEAQKQWFTKFQTWAKATVPGEIDRVMLKGT